jgi:hypothetical protein
MTYKEIVYKIIHDSVYAKEIAELLAKARKKDQAAIDELKKKFTPLPAELADLGFKKPLHCYDTDPTEWLLIDFAAFVK